VNEWKPIETAPMADETDVIVGWDSATVWVVCSAWYRNADDVREMRDCGNDDADETYIGWWSYRNSVAQEMVKPTHWLCEVPNPPIFADEAAEQ
jgi:hypothetical protein